MRKSNVKKIEEEIRLKHDYESRYLNTTTNLYLAPMVWYLYLVRKRHVPLHGDVQRNDEVNKTYVSE